VETRLLEREPDLEVLQSALNEAGAGTGSAVLLFGEAGIGKTSVLTVGRSPDRQIVGDRGRGLRPEPPPSGTG
jgi:predicted ATPase